MSEQPAILVGPVVTVRQLKRLYEVRVSGIGVALETSAHAANTKADRLRERPDEAAEMLEAAQTWRKL